MFSWLTGLAAQLVSAAHVAGHVLAGLAALAVLAGPPGSAPPAGLIAVAAIVLAAITIALARGVGGARIAVQSSRSLSGRLAALRDRARGAMVARQRDPDAPGRARPRAPTAAPAAA